MNEENTEEVKVLEAQIEQLQAEVAQLQRQQQNNHKDMTFNFSGQMQEALLYLCGQSVVRTKEEVVSRLEEEVKEMEEDLKRQTQMNGINLNSCTTKTLQSGDSQLIQKFCVSGYCSELNFLVEFQLTEFKQNQRCQREISDLNVVMDATDLKSFNGFLLNVEEHNDHLLFFRTLRTFSDRCDDRSRTFQHLQDRLLGEQKELLCMRCIPKPFKTTFVNTFVRISETGYCKKTFIILQAWKFFSQLGGLFTYPLVKTKCLGDGWLVLLILKSIYHLQITFRRLPFFFVV
uniref:centromere protein P isoform X2 n=1 Tax=Solea senegalensis TaxID=28829 RepID=UPI001CD8D710|nr:centromere protein P isoform X2 [Solea senegalensis]